MCVARLPLTARVRTVDPEEVLRSARLGVVVSLVFAACSPEPLGNTEQAATIPLQNFDFGQVQVGMTSAAHTFTISPASGVQQDTVESIVPTSGSCGDFTLDATGLPATVSSTCVAMGSDIMMQSTITPVQSCSGYSIQKYNFRVSFHPRFAAQESCVLKVTISGVVSNLTVSGLGTEPPVRIDVSPSPLDFGNVLATQASSPTPLTVTNFGSDPAGMEVLSVALDSGSQTNGTFAITSGDVGPHNVPYNGGTDAFTLTCKPPAQGTYTGALTITTKDPATPTVVPLTCNGIMSNLQFLDATGSFTASPVTLVGTQLGGATRIGEPLDVTLTLKDATTSTAPVTIHSLAVTSSELQILSGPPPETTLQVGESTQVMVRYLATTAMPQGTIGNLVATIDNNQTRDTSIMGAAVETSMSVTPDGTVESGTDLRR